MSGSSAVYAAIISVLKFWPVWLVCHLLFSWAMAAMARRRGIPGWAAAWIPMMNLGIMGQLSDQYRYVVQGKRARNRIWLPVLTVVLELLMIFGAFGLQGGLGFVPALWATVLDILTVLTAVRIARCLYRLYLSCAPNRAVALTVWSVCVPLLPPVFLWLHRKAERGMPMRKVAETSQSSDAETVAVTDDTWAEQEPTPTEALEPSAAVIEGEDRQQQKENGVTNHG